MRAAWIYWLGYGVLSWLYAWERVHYDAPLYIMKMLKTGGFTFEHFRTTGPFFEWMPWLAARLGAGLEWIVRWHSLNDWAAGFGVFLWLGYGLRSLQAAGAWTFAMAVGYRHNFVVPVSELYPAIGLLTAAAFMRRAAWLPALWGWTGHILSLPATAGWMLWHALRYGFTSKLVGAGMLSAGALVYHLVVSTGYQAAQAGSLFSSAAVSLALPCPVQPYFKLDAGDWARVLIMSAELVPLGIWGLWLWYGKRFARAEAALFALATACALVFLTRPHTLMIWGFDMSERYVFFIIFWLVWALFFRAPRARIWTFVAVSSVVQLFFFLQRYREVRFARLDLLCRTMNRFPEQKFLIRESNWVTEKIGTDVGLWGETVLYSMARYGTVKQAISEEAMAAANVKFIE
ncbi:MAG: hypothetical protein RMM53_01635, partial [Bacteroidia bacterium]|nr:hypothetical protein [Bacteroidia bacterium]